FALLATPDIYTLSLHDALPIWLDVARNAYAIAYGPIMADRDARAAVPGLAWSLRTLSAEVTDAEGVTRPAQLRWVSAGWGQATLDRKSTRLNSSHSQISYAVFC